MYIGMYANANNFFSVNHIRVSSWSAMMIILNTMSLRKNYISKKSEIKAQRLRHHELIKMM